MEAFLLFVLYSFFGCVLEDLYHLAMHGRYVSKRTLLKLPLCPVYGVSALVLWAVNGATKNPLLLFANGFFAVSAAELAFYLISRRVYGVVWWDYSGHRVNFMGGISLFYSCMWGILNIFFARIVHPVCLRACAGVPRNMKLFCGLFLAVYVLADIKDTHRELIKRKNGERNCINESFLYLKHNN